MRDVAHSRSLDYPVWSTEITPVTGKWRIETVEINGVVQIGGVGVASGDLVLADETGICFVSRERVEEVLEIARRKVLSETKRLAAIEQGIPLPELLRTTVA